MEGRNYTPVKIFDSVDENTFSSMQNVASYRNICFAVVGANSPTATVKFYGAFAKSAAAADLDYPPDTGVSASKTNIYAPVAFCNLNDGSIVDGDTGIAFTGTAGIYLVEINTNALAHVAVEVSGYSAGDVTVVMFEADNE